MAAFKSESKESLQLHICGPEKVSGSEIAERFSKALGRKISFRPMPPEEFAKAISYDGNDEAIIGYYRSVFDDPSIMTTNVDFEYAIGALPIKPTDLEAFAGAYKGYLSRH